MKKILFALLIVLAFSCTEKEEVTPELQKAQLENVLSKKYKVDFIVSAKGGGHVDILAPTILVLDTDKSNDTLGGSFYLDFAYSFESDLVSELFLDVSDIIIRMPKDYVVAKILVDGVVVVSDSTNMPINGKLNIKYTIKK